MIFFSFEKEDYPLAYAHRHTSLVDEHGTLLLVNLLRFSDRGETVLIFLRIGICDIFLVPALNILFLWEMRKSVSSLDLICCQHRLYSKTPFFGMLFMLLPFSFCWSCLWPV